MHIPHDSPLYAAIVERSATFLGANLEFRPAEVYAQSGVLGAWPYLVLVVVMGVTTWSQSQLMIKMQPAPDPQFAQTQKIMRWMPLMLVFFSWNFPAGLILYWAATNTWTIGQQYVLLKKFGGPAPEVTKKNEKGWLARTAAAALESSSSGESTPESKPAAGKGSPTRSKPKAGSTPAKGRPAQGTRSPSGKGGGAKDQPGARRPAAKQARVAPKAGTSTGNGKDKAGSVGAKANGDSPTPPRPAGRPKGSGSRKGNKGGRR